MLHSFSLYSVTTKSCRSTRSPGLKQTGGALLGRIHRNRFQAHARRESRDRVVPLTLGPAAWLPSSGSPSKITSRGRRSSSSSHLVMAPTGTLPLGHSSQRHHTFVDRIAQVDVLQGYINGLRSQDRDLTILAVENLANANRRNEAATQRKRQQQLSDFGRIIPPWHEGSV